MRIPKVLLTALFLARLAPGPAAEATPIVFTDREAFNAAVGDHTLLTFDGPSPPYEIDPLTYVATVTIDGIFRYGGDYEVIPSFGGIPGSVLFGAATAQLGAVLLQPVMAVGFDVTPLSPINIRDGQTIPVPPSARVMVSGPDSAYLVTEPQFLGWRFDAPVTDFSILELFQEVESPDGPLPGRSVFAIDNLAIQTAPVPEPALTVLALLGAGGLGAARWLARRRR